MILPDEINWASALSSFNLGVEPGIVTRSVSEDEAAILGIPRLRFGLLFLPLTQILRNNETVAKGSFADEDGWEAGPARGCVCSSLFVLAAKRRQRAI